MTHPNILKKGEGKKELFVRCSENLCFLKVTPGFSTVEYERRRSNLIKALPESSAVVCLGYGTRYMSNNIFYPYHQKTDFLYLCGFNEPDAALILGKKKTK